MIATPLDPFSLQKPNPGTVSESIRSNLDCKSIFRYFLSGKWKIRLKYGCLFYQSFSPNVFSAFFLCRIPRHTFGQITSSAFSESKFLEVTLFMIILPLVFIIKKAVCLFLKALLLFCNKSFVAHCRSQTFQHYIIGTHYTFFSAK